MKAERLENGMIKLAGPIWKDQFPEERLKSWIACTRTMATTPTKMQLTLFVPSGCESACKSDPLRWVMSV
ncbi:hypothetical protein AT574_12530 [Phaeobacter inhibens]|nr:hypothetical protein AT574_12530 [Phaeobacter inhibens]